MAGGFWTRIKRQGGLLFLCIALGNGAPTGAAAGGGKRVLLCVDMVHAVSLDHPASSLYIGNPSIADIVAKQGKSVLLQARAVGNTNVLALDEAGKVVAKWRVIVRETMTERVTVIRATARQTLSCAPRCEPVPAAGDEAEAFKALSGQIKTRIDTAMETARSAQ